MTNPNSEPPRTSWFALQPDAPPNRAIGWLRTTAGAVAILLLVQIATGILLTNFYVPYPGVAHTTVSYIEKMAAGGSWIRSLHHYGSQWLAVFLALHIAQMIWFEGYLRRPVGWWVSIVLLGLVMAEGATGYSLPWDIRAFYATRITEGLVAGLPLVGQLLRRWVIGGDSISPVTITRFYSAHILTVPLLIIIVIAI